MKLEKELRYNLPEIEVGPGFSTIQKDIKKSEENFQFLVDLDNKAKEKYDILGGYFSLTVADGKVPYQLVEINNKLAKVVRCAGICLDQYEDQILGNEAWIPLKKAEELINYQRRLSALFNKKQ